MGTLKHRKSWLKTIEGRSQVLRSYNKLALKLFIICSIFICSAGKLYAEEQSGSFFEETLMTESFAEAAEVENCDEEAESGGLAAFSPAAVMESDGMVLWQYRLLIQNLPRTMFRCFLHSSSLPQGIFSCSEFCFWQTAERNGTGK